MPCVSKTILCALAARAGLAVRQSLKMDRSGASENVLEQIGALIQAHGKSAVQSEAIDNLHLLTAVTPESKAALDDALRKVIAELELNVDSKIKDGFRASQSKVDTTVSEIVTSTDFAVEQKSVADNADNEWSKCIEVEKSKRVAIEAAVAAEKIADAATVAPCQEQKDSTMYNFDPNSGGANQWAFACDFSSGDACDQGLQAYEERVTQMLSGLTTEADIATSTYTAAKGKCESTTATFNAKQQARVDAVAAWQLQKTVCQTAHENRRLGMCNFGMALQTKCTKVDAYNKLIGDVGQVNGGEHSEPDRAKEWESTAVTKCMLNLVIAGSDINEASRVTCTDQVDYANDVGAMDLKETQFSTLTSATSFTCAEKQITFSGGTWNVPAGDSPASDTYTKTSYHPEVHLAEDSAAFQFC